MTKLSRSVLAQGGYGPFRRGTQRDDVGGEEGALHQLCRGVVAVGVVCAPVADGGEVDGVQRLGGVELAQTAVAVGTVVVVDAVGAVAALLYLG